MLAAVARLCDVGRFRIGGEEYASGGEATFGLVALCREHVTVVGGAVRFRCPAKGGVEWTLDVTDEPARKVVRGLLERVTDQPEFLVYRVAAGGAT